MRIHLVDGTYELFRAYFGAPPAVSADGRQVGAVRGLAATLLALLHNDGVSHIGVAFDHVIESFRNRLFGGYKNGAGVAADLLAQFPLAEEMTAALGCTVWPMVEFEADDAIAAAVHRYATDEVEQVVICSPDKDLAQLVRDSRIVCLDRRRGVVLDEAGVRRKFGVDPVQIPEYLALVGDSADGIPGIPGFGAKTAAAVLQQFGRIAAVPVDPDAWPATIRGRARLAATLSVRRDEARLYTELATLRPDAPVTETTAAIEWHGVHADFKALCGDLGFDELAERPQRWAP